MEQDELIDRDLTLTVQLPGGQEREVTVHGSKPVMDLLVTLCAQYHLNPSDHIIKLISTNQNQIKFKPNSLIGSLEAERVVLKPKGSDENNSRMSNMPVATVRLMINYRTSHKAVVRVNPRVPLAELMPAVCEKCEFDPNTTVLLRDGQSEDPLDLTKTLNDYGIRDLYAKDTKVISDTLTDAVTHNVCEEEKVIIREKHQREKENKGFLSLFRRSKKTAEEVSNTNSVLTSPAAKTQHVVNIGCLKGNSPTSTPFAEMPKKRRAPQPPVMMGSQSFPCGLNSSQSITVPTDPASGKQGVLSRVSSTESSLKRTKRRAPPPPCSSPSQDSSDKVVPCVGASLNLSSLEEAEENDVLPDSSDSFTNEYSDFTASWPIQSPSLMTEILSEFMDITKAEEQREHSPDSSSITCLPPAVSNSSNLQSPQAAPARSEDCDPAVPPGYLLWRNRSQREGLTTFTVVPRRRPASLRQYEVIITLEGSDSLEQSNGERGIQGSNTKQEDLEWKCSQSENSEPKKTENLELCENEMMSLAKHDPKSTNLEANDAHLGNPEPVEEAFDKLKLNTDMEKNISKEREDDLLPVEEEEEEEEEERDWVEEYRNRRRRFQEDNGDWKPVKLDRWMMEEGREEEQNGFQPPPPLQVYWKEGENEKNDQERKRKVRFKISEEEDKESNASTVHPKPPTHTVYVPDADWNVNHSSDWSSSNPDSGAQVPLTHQPPDSGQSLFKPHPESVRKDLTSPVTPPLSSSSHSDRNDASNPKIHPTGDVHSTAPMSLFALAVSQRAQSLKRGMCPLSPSTQGSCSQIKPPRVMCSQNPPRHNNCNQSTQAVWSSAWSSPSPYKADKHVRD